MDLTLNEGLTLVGLILGPAIGSYLVVRLEDYKSQRSRRMNIFVTLMRTRGQSLSFDHVNALNLIEVEFHNDKEVITAWKEYLGELSKPPLVNAAAEAISNRAEDRRKSLAKLIHKISKVLKFKIEQFDIFESNYTPQGWHDDEQQQKYLRMLLINLLSGTTSIPVTLREQAEETESLTPFPPRPSAE